MDHAPIPPLYDTLRRQIEHEDGLITQRISWLVASQSFLFTAFAIAANTQEGASSPRALRHAHLLDLLPSVAIGADVLIYISILGGVVALGKLRERWDGATTPTERAQLPPLQGPTAGRWMGIASPLLLPLVFLAVWIFLLVTTGTAVAT